jgi:2-dehydro-3-deoxygalactonokinase
MIIATIDCGTTNSRVFLVDETGRVLALASKKVGVRDTAIHGSNLVLREGLKATLEAALGEGGLNLGDVRFAISSGMITSELGLIEVPHLWAPVGLEELAANLKMVRDPTIFPADMPIYFVRGVKNHYDPDTARIADVGGLDFMRGEETQVAGLLALHKPTLPLTVVILSSHTKFIALDGAGRILGSITTLSGQVYEAILKETSIGKSIRASDGFDDQGYFDPQLVEAAYDWVSRSGFLRAMLMPRFLDTLLKTRWHERKLFVEAAIAADDLRAFSHFEGLGYPPKAGLVLVGSPRRCALYRHLLETRLNVREQIVELKDAEAVDRLSIHGALHLASMAGLLAS